MAKQSSLRKTIKNNKKKKLNLKNLNFKKDWKKLTFSGALALLLFSSISLAGYTYLEQRNLEAQAAGGTLIWSTVTSRGSMIVTACKSNMNALVRTNNKFPGGAYSVRANGFEITTLANSTNARWVGISGGTLSITAGGVMVGSKSASQIRNC